MGSKTLKGERELTVEHVRKLAARFRVRPELFID
jgi:antitoxin component HigA of HigAB toxin-antitoxin module